jgi:hypothetical protein
MEGHRVIADAALAKIEDPVRDLPPSGDEGLW